MAQEVARKDQEIARKDQEMTRKDQEVASMAQEIAVKDGRVQQLQCEVEVKGNSYISNTIITHLRTQELREGLQLRETELEEELRSKETKRTMD